MKRYILILLLSVCAAGRSLASGDDAQAVLRRTADYVKELGDYRAAFEITAADYASTGSYAVAGDAYYIAVDGAEVYSDGKVRYEVDNARREVTVDEVNIASRNVLDNPTRCFDFVGSDYSSEITSREKGAVTLHLRSTDPDIEGDIYLTVDEATGRPSRLEYVLYDDRITVCIVDLSRSDEPVKRFERSAYRDYETIDFR